MPRALELRPLVVAMLVGALALWTLGYVKRGTGSHRRDLALGAGVGAIVQVGVRLAGVS
jgi:hypothetical protein